MPDSDPRTRYVIESIAFAEDLNSMMIRFHDPSMAAGPILNHVQEVVVNLREDDDVRAGVWEMCNALCDIIDDSHRAMRAAQ